MPLVYQKEQHFSSTSTLEISDHPTCSKDQITEEKISDKQEDKIEEESPNYENRDTSISNEYSSVEEDEDDEKDDCGQGVYDDVGLPSQERVNSLYAGSSAGSQPGSTSNGKESEWEDLEDVKPSLPLPKRNVTW